MKKMQAILVVCLLSSALLAHPHFRKRLTTSLPSGAEVTVSYATTAANEARAEATPENEFVTPRGPVLTVSAGLSAGSVSIPAGEYTIGVIKTGAESWKMALYAGRVGRQEKPDPSKLIQLDSMYWRGTVVEHLFIDVSPGHGEFEGKSVLSMRFGSLSLDGLLG